MNHLQACFNVYNVYIQKLWFFCDQVRATKHRRCEFRNFRTEGLKVFQEPRRQLSRLAQVNFDQVLEIDQTEPGQMG